MLARDRFAGVRRKFPWSLFLRSTTLRQWLFQNADPEQHLHLITSMFVAVSIASQTAAQPRFDMSSPVRAKPDAPVTRFPFGHVWSRRQPMEWSQHVGTADLWAGVQGSDGYGDGEAAPRENGRQDRRRGTSPRIKICLHISFSGTLDFSSRAVGGQET